MYRARGGMGGINTPQRGRIRIQCRRKENQERKYGGGKGLADLRASIEGLKPVFGEKVVATLNSPAPAPPVETRPDGAGTPLSPVWREGALLLLRGRRRHSQPMSPSASLVSLKALGMP